MASLRSRGVLGLESGRRPDAGDWLLLAVGDELTPIRTAPSVVDERLGVVVYATRPPNDQALGFLGRLTAGEHRPEIEAGASANEEAEAREAYTWALDTAEQIVAALRGSLDCENRVQGPFSSGRSLALMGQCTA